LTFNFLQTFIEKAARIGATKQASSDELQDELDHLLQQLVDLVLTAAEVTTFDEVVNLLPPATGRSVQLERPQEVGGILEVGANGQNLVDKVLHADDAELAQGALNQVVGGDGGAVAVDLDKSTLVDQLTHRLEVGSSPSDVRLSGISSSIFSKWSDGE